MPSAAMRSRRSMQGPRESSAGTSPKAGCGAAASGTRSRRRWPVAFWGGWSGASGVDREAEVGPVTPFLPRPDRRRRTPPAIHREVARWLRHQAVRWWVTTDRFMELCSRRF
jgi:hypothetical protein